MEDASMSKPRKTEQLEELARSVVGDDKTPDIFFVTDQGTVVTVSRDFKTAYTHWCELAARYPRVECALENRTYGVLADISPESDEPGARLVRTDDTYSFRKGRV